MCAVAVTLGISYFQKMVFLSYEGKQGKSREDLDETEGESM